MTKTFVLALALILIAGGVRSRVGASIPPPCSAPQSHELDFWVGDWDVRNPAGKVEGTDRITREFAGCVLEEHFLSDDRASYGSSFAFYDELHGQWHYTWVDNLGAFELLDGRRVGNSLVLSGWHIGRVHKHVVDRIAWTPLQRKVRQLWQASADGGRTWQTVTDVYYWPRRSQISRPAAR